MNPDALTRLVVTPDRDSADTAAETIAADGLSAAPRVVREALAGEDDAEDAQWLVVVEAPAEGWTAEALTALEDIASGHEGWLESGELSRRRLSWRRVPARPALRPL